MAIPVERTLTTILCADVEGYSALMGRDEVGTFETLQRYRVAMRGLIERHRGRLVNTWGDGLIAAFPSVVEAVQCAVETQRELRGLNDGLATDRRLLFRIGINLGDVMVQEGDLYGDGVNVAARLQTLAEPGGIVISGTVYDHVRTKLPVSFDFAGQQRVKNIADPVPAFRVRLDEAPSRGPDPTPEPGPWSWSRRSRDRRRAARGRSAREARSRTAATSPTRGRRTTGVLVVAALFFFLVNLFSGIGDVWFHWPTLVIALILGLRWAWRL